MLCLVGIGPVDADQPAGQPGQNQTEQVIKINAHKFEFVPNLITLKKGVPVILELTSSDVLMGFYAPDLKAHATIIPGVVTRIRLVPENAGVFTFLCDIFCGDGHENMSGTITVVS
jgi:cytochrome c oxidase subunit 2